MTIPITAVAARHPAAELRETHSSIVILVGALAYKIKKPVDLGFLDFRSVAARERACRHEIELNRRLAPDVYPDLASLVRSDGTDAEPVIVMRRLPDELRLSTLIETDGDVDDQLRAVARVMAGFHSSADRSPAIAAEGGPDGLRRRWVDNLRECVPYTDTFLDSDLYHRIRRLALRYVDGRTALLQQRAAAGHTVDGHGDLLAEDVFCLADGPRVLDCLEFDDRLRWIDVLDDVAFLAMDLERMGHPDLATRFLAWYAEFSANIAVESLTHHYIAYRAFVRAKVSCIRAAQGEASAAAEADSYARLALRHLEAGEIRLILIGGGPGTGKTTVATALADRIGAVLIGTDAVRREHHFEASVRYSAEAKDATYRDLLGRARRALELGETVVADATWGDAAWRRAAQELTVATSSRLVSFQCEAPVDVAAQRAQSRAAAGGGASEANAAVARALAVHRDVWPTAVPLDTTGEVSEAVASAVKALEAHGWIRRPA